MRDGKNLIKLLEILSGERLPKPTKGKMRIHCLENVDKALQFLRDQRVHLENIGAHDIVDFSRPSVSHCSNWHSAIENFKFPPLSAEPGSYLDNHPKIPNPGYYNRRSRQQGDKVREGRTSLVVSNENCRISERQHSQLHDFVARRLGVQRNHPQTSSRFNR